MAKSRKQITATKRREKKVQTDTQVNRLSNKQLHALLHELSQNHDWQIVDQMLRAEGHQPIETNTVGFKVQNQDDYTAISQDYGKDVALVSVFLKGQSLGSSKFSKFEVPNDGQLSDLKNFWQRLINALVNSTTCLPTCAVEAYTCTKTVSWDKPWYVTACDLLVCAISKSDCGGCIADAFRQAFHGG